MKKVYDDTSSMYNEQEYMLTPCRFSPSGWKYIKKDQD